jgi:hypothetical protein
MPVSYIDQAERQMAEYSDWLRELGPQSWGEAPEPTASEAVASEATTMCAEDFSFAAAKRPAKRNRFMAWRGRA